MAQHTLSASIQRLHVEDINTLHLSENLKTLETGGLFDIGGDSTRSSTWGHKVGLALDFY